MEQKPENVFGSHCGHAPRYVQSADADIKIKALERIFLGAPRSAGGNRSRMELFSEGALAFHIRNAGRACSSCSASFNPELLSSNLTTKLQDKEVMQWICDAANSYDAAVKAHLPFEDLLSPLFALSVGSEDLGQCFTPKDLTSLVAELYNDHVSRHPRRNTEQISVHDPAIGAGSLPLSYFQSQVVERGQMALAGARLAAFDIDPLCIAMASLQILASANLFRVPLGHVELHVRNALTNEGEIAFKCRHHSFSNALHYGLPIL